MNILLTYNALSGSFCESKLDALTEMLVSRGHEVARHDSHDPQLPELIPLHDHVCVLGGDGTLRDVIGSASLGQSNTSFSQLPLGTINLVAREMGFNTNLLELVSRIEQSVTSPNHINIAEANGSAVLVCASVGPDSYAVDGVSLKIKSHLGRFAYALSFIKLLYSWPRKEFSISVNNQNLVGEAVYVLNGKYYAGNWQLSSDANMRSDTLSVLILPKARRRDFARLILMASFGEKFGSPSWQRLQCKKLSISSNKPCRLQIDGDPGAKLPVNISLRRDVISFA